MIDETHWFEKPEELDTTLGVRMKMALRFSGISVGAMSFHLQSHRNTLSSWLADRAKPSLAVLRVWADKTGVPLEWLRDGIWPDPPTGDSDSPAA